MLKKDARNFFHSLFDEKSARNSLGFLLHLPQIPVFHTDSLQNQAAERGDRHDAVPDLRQTLPAGRPEQRW